MQKVSNGTYRVDMALHPASEARFPYFARVSRMLIAGAACQALSCMRNVLEAEKDTHNEDATFNRSVFVLRPAFFAHDFDFGALLLGFIVVVANEVLK
jgi:hypothetical protein